MGNKHQEDTPGDDLVSVDAVFGVIPQQICLKKRTKILLVSPTFSFP